MWGISHAFTIPYPHSRVLGYNADTVWQERLPSMRVSPSGKARASQARIRGFESRHPLHRSSTTAQCRRFRFQEATMTESHPIFDTFIFDLDGTILDTMPDLIHVTN